MQKLTKMSGVEIGPNVKNLQAMPAMNQMMSQMENTNIPEQIRHDHAAQNMEYVFTELAEEQEKATKN